MRSDESINQIAGGAFHEQEATLFRVGDMHALLGAGRICGSQGSSLFPTAGLHRRGEALHGYDDGNDEARNSCPCGKRPGNGTLSGPADADRGRHLRNDATGFNPFE